MTAGQPGDRSAGRGLPQEWDAIAEATAQVRMHASRVIGASVHGDLQPVAPDEISLQEVQLLGRNGDDARERFPAIANLLLQGDTDAAIAKTIGVSVRTVASEVRSLMDATGASTRYQTAMRLFDR